jgi:hypothetical protein
VDARSAAARETLGTLGRGQGVEEEEREVKTAEGGTAKMARKKCSRITRTTAYNGGHDVTETREDE